MNRHTPRILRATRIVAAIAAALLGALLAAAAASPEAGASVGPATAAAVAADLGANKIPAALVILIDTSDSMAPPNGLYPDVYRQLPKFLTALHNQDPADQVSVVTFSDKADTQVIYNWGAPQDFRPPASPQFRIGTDIGYAFQVALSQFGSAPKNALVDGVLLLSDGGMWAPDDPAYDGGHGYQASGWAGLRQQVQGLNVTGYGLPLVGNPTVVGDLGRALSEGFGSQQVMLSSNLANLSGEMVAAQQRILDSRVAAAADPDSGHGVLVKWSGPGVTNGTVQLNLASGTADPSLTLTATTSRVPLEVQDLRASVSGFPEPITGTVAGPISLSAGQHVTVPLQLTWKPDSASQTFTGTITLSAHVGSPDSDAIRNYYHDRSFAVGGLAGAASAYYQAGPPAPPNLALIFAIVVLVLIACGFVLVVLFLRMRLSGTITFTPEDGQGKTAALPTFPPWLVFDTRELGVDQGVIIVRRSLKTGEMRLTSLTHRKNPVVLRDNGSTTIAGIRVRHDAGRPHELVGR